MKHFTIGDIRIFSGSIENVLKFIKQAVRKKFRTYICCIGAHGIVESFLYPHVLEAHKKAGLVVSDGMPIVWFARACGFKLTQRIYGPDLMRLVCGVAVKKKWRIFLFGSTANTLSRLKKELESSYPKLIICGTFAPPLSDFGRQRQDMIQIINQSDPHIVFVGLGTPKQEKWMFKNRRELKAPMLIGVGAAFDFIAHTKHQAPIWVREHGFEWLFRMVSEPARLAPRYARVILIFPFLWIVEYFKYKIRQHA